jgi:hypothetical protein
MSQEWQKGVETNFEMKFVLIFIGIEFRDFGC